MLKCRQAAETTACDLTKGNAKLHIAGVTAPLRKHEFNNQNVDYLSLAI